MEGLMLWILSVSITLCLLVVVFTCVCGCRKTEPKNELMGLAGLVKLTNPEETFSQNGQWQPASTSLTLHSSDSNANKRCSTTANRSLPDLPVDIGNIRHPDGSVIWESQEGGGDTGSELYATVEENSRPGLNHWELCSQVRRTKFVPRELSSESKEESEGTREGVSPSCLPNTGDDGFPTYARLRKEHPYDKLKKCEHPYAQVRPHSSRELDCEPIPSERYDASDPVPPPRARKSLSHSSLTPPQGSLSAGVNAGADSPHSPRSAHLPCSPHGSTPDIAAAIAIAGRISANQDLPYMTPPIATSQTQTVQHFSGDSQDSSKGYTSISVREPLANIRQQRPHDCHYTTVSDDSDEMYAAIEDPSQVYTSGSETYAQIQPLVLSSIPVLPDYSHSPEVVNCDEIASTATQTVSPQLYGSQGILAPQPPSVDSLKHVAQAHSRQASSSSAASSVTNLGSPKPEKRPANSPLPPPPANLASPEGGCSLEDMYAKVVKKKRGSSEETERRSHETDSPQSQPPSPQRRFSTPLPAEASISSDPGYETVSATELTVQETNQQQHTGYETVRQGTLSDSDPNYEELQVQRKDPGYAHIQKRSEVSEPEYALIARETLKNKAVQQELEPDYASISRSKKSVNNANGTMRGDLDDPGYEQVRLHKESAGDDSDNPGYERVHSNPSVLQNLNTLPKDEVGNDPGYEQVRLSGLTPERDYEGLLLNQSDPNYETVRNDEPNYESVHYFNDSSELDQQTSKRVVNIDDSSNPLIGRHQERSGL